MEKFETRLRFNGKAVENHSMSIEASAWSLLHLSDMIKEANKIARPGKAKPNIEISTNVEQRCFEIGILFQYADPAFIKLVYDLGIVNVSASISVLDIFKIFKGRRIDPDKISPEDEHGNVTINIDGDNEGDIYLGEKTKGSVNISGNNKGDIIVGDKSIEKNKTIEKNKDNTIIANNHIVKIYDSKAFRISAKNFLTPLSDDGINTVEFGEKDNPMKFSKEEYKGIASYDISAEEDVQIELMTKNASIFKPAFTSKAKIWEFRDVETKQIIKADISGTDIAEHTISEGTFNINDIYELDLEFQVWQKIKRKQKKYILRGFKKIN